MRNRMMWTFLVVAVSLALYWIAAAAQSRSTSPFEVGKKFNFSSAGSAQAYTVTIIEVYRNGWVKVSGRGSSTEMLLNTSVMTSAWEVME